MLLPLAINFGPILWGAGIIIIAQLPVQYLCAYNPLWFHPRIRIVLCLHCLWWRESSIRRRQRYTDNTSTGIFYGYVIAVGAKVLQWKHSKTSGYALLRRAFQAHSSIPPLSRHLENPAKLDASTLCQQHWPNSLRCRVNQQCLVASSIFLWNE